MMEYRLVDKMECGSSEGSQQEEPTDLSNKKQPVLRRKGKPIPPPLDLSLNLNNNHHPHLVNQPSPKYSDKSLPIRKRWHSWSPVPIPMNGQEEPSMVPLYPDNNPPATNNTHQHPKTGLATTQPNHYHHHHLPPYASPHLYTPTRTWTLDFVPTTPTPTSISSSSNNNNSRTNNSHQQQQQHNGHHQHHHAHSGQNSSGDLQTPTPFYTPNEPSPKFMNSPVFSYSNPDTALYQGPFSPIRASTLYPPPSSPFTNLSLNSPLLPLSGVSTQTSTPITSSSSSSSSSSCFNMIPSTLLSPAPSQASTNSLSYEDLHEKSLNFFQPVWSIFLPGTKVRFVTGMNSMDWYPVDFLAQSGDSLGLKGEYAPHGLEVRKFIVTSSSKERIQVTFCPVGDPHHPTIEVNCEPGHPFMVDKKGWCAVKPEVFQEIYGSPCQVLECGDICLNISPARSPNQQHYHQHHQQSFNSQSTHIVGVQQTIKMEPVDEKPVPISVLPHHQHQQHHPSQILGLPNNHSSHSQSASRNGPVINGNPPQSRKTFAMSTPNKPPAKKLKESVPKVKKGGGGGGIGGENKGRRPMNGFLLFAKDKRPELIQMYPGKDNRSISVLLGEAWQTLNPTEREKYSLNAKARAEEQKRIHPDCWKRKRSQSIVNS